ncbi:MAG: hypothetical protein H6704_18705 [Myxococcales bacterium]|nr:hypothetical protein [Myxococcales bacterium]
MRDGRPLTIGLLLVALGHLPGCYTYDTEAADAFVPPSASPTDAAPCACTAGDFRCAGPAQVEVCRARGAGCPTWQAEPPCSGANARCVGDGICCSDLCPEEGATVCEGDAVRTCRRSAYGCLDFDAPTPCPPDTYCADGACRPTCPEGAFGLDCTPGTHACLDDQRAALCTVFERECTRLVEVERCGDDTRCVDGACRGECVPECRVRTGECLDHQTLERCVPGPDGCPRLEQVACPHRCFEGACAPSCDQCEVGALRCEDQVAYGCARGDDGCLDWQVDGRCGLNCVDACDTPGTHQCGADGNRFECVVGPEGCYVERFATPCTLGTHRCDGLDAFQTCVVSEQGCNVWGAPAPCTDGGSCGRGADRCAGTCDDACEIGSVECGENPSTVRVCEPDAGGCGRWSGSRACRFGLECADAPRLCGGQCPVLCDPGARECGRRSTMRTCTLMEDGCPAWVESECVEPVVDCFRSPALCMGTCGEQCELGARRCLLDWSYEVCVTDRDTGCRRFETRRCTGLTTCAEDPAACFVECPLGQTCVGWGRAICAGADGTMFRRCDRGADGCWRFETHACETDTPCFEDPAACFGPCPSECEPGTLRCTPSDFAAQFCAIDPGSGCAYWNDARACFHGGRCAGDPERCLSAAP